MASTISLLFLKSVNNELEASLNASLINSSSENGFSFFANKYDTLNEAIVLGQFI